MKSLSILLVYILSVAAAHAQDSAAIYYHLGIQQWKNTETRKQAYQSFTNSIRIQPTDSAYFLRSRCNVADRIPDLDTAIMLNKKYTEAYLDRGIFYMASNRFKDALADFNTAIKLQPDSAVCYWLKAMLYQGEGNYKLALRTHTKGIKAQPTNGSAYRIRGDLYMEMENYEAALQDYNNAIANNAGIISIAYTKRGECKFILGDEGGACADLQQAAKMGDKRAQKLFKNNCD